MVVPGELKLSFELQNTTTHLVCYSLEANYRKINTQFKLDLGFRPNLN